MDYSASGGVGKEGPSVVDAEAGREKFANKNVKFIKTGVDSFQHHCRAWQEEEKKWK